jgi:hypothetical protein
MTKFEFALLLVTASATLLNMLALIFLFLSKAHEALMSKYVGIAKQTIVGELNSALVNVENRFKGIEAYVTRVSSGASSTPVSTPVAPQPSIPEVSPPAV